VITVSNTSPLTSLAAVEQLSLLPQLYGQIVIPTEVARELAVVAPGLPGHVPVSELSWLTVRAVADPTLVTLLLSELDPGESEAIALARELNADFLLIDERRGRLTVSRLGIERVGVLGVLIRAKSEGILPFVKPVLDDLVTRAGFWVSRALYTFLLNEIGE
jgi:hypothetical protein